MVPGVRKNPTLGTEGRCYSNTSDIAIRVDLGEFVFDTLTPPHPPREEGKTYENGLERNEVDENLETTKSVLGREDSPNYRTRRRTCRCGRARGELVLNEYSLETDGI